MVKSARGKNGFRRWGVRATIFAICAFLPLVAHAQQGRPSSVTREEKKSVFGYSPAADFRAFDPQYRNKSNGYKAEWEALQKEVYRQAKAGRKTPCVRQLLVESHWLIHYTARYADIEQRLQELRALLKQPADPPDAGQQSPEDGSYSRCCHEWFYKLDTCCDRLVIMQYLEEKPRYPLRFLDRINSPSSLRSYLDGLLVADVAKTGENTAFELNLAASDLTRLVLGELPSGYTFHPQLKSTLLDYLDSKWQDPQTGYWGCWYKTPDGTIRKTADMSLTFHLVHYREGKVKHWPQIIATTLAMRDLEWPYGWLQEGQFSNHHNYDVVSLFHYGWPFMTPAQKTTARAEIRRMLDFCLKKSLQPDGSFALGDEATLASSFAFPCLFLYEIGFFNKENRFWTNEPFPQAKEIAKRVARRIKALKMDDPEAQEALLIVENAD